MRVRLWLVFLLIPIGHGWGYRRWGFPYLRYHYRRRAVAGRQTREWDADPEAAGQPAGWGWGADLIWVFLLVALIWIGVAAWAW